MLRPNKRGLLSRTAKPRLASIVSGTVIAANMKVTLTDWATFGSFAIRT